MNDLLTADGMRTLLRDAVKQAGGMRKWAAIHEIPVSIVSETLSRKRDVSEAIANAVGCFKITVYRCSHSVEHTERKAA